jgi:hypothetical protein
VGETGYTCIPRGSGSDFNSAFGVSELRSQRFVGQSKATNFMGPRARSHQFCCARQSSWLALLSSVAQNRTIALAHPSIRGNEEKQFLKCVNYLTLLDRFLNDAG